MKIAFSILCSLMLVWAQAVVAAVPATAQAETQDCGCGGKMACCQTAPATPTAPLDITVSDASQQILSPVPATVVWVWAAAGTPSISSASPLVLTVDAMPLFARHCVRLL